MFIIIPSDASPYCESIEAFNHINFEKSDDIMDLSIYVNYILMVPYVEEKTYVGRRPNLRRTWKFQIEIYHKFVG